MKKEIAERWVEALRSGKYEQGRHELRGGDKFCCLGVLCDISGLGAFDKFGEYYIGHLGWDSVTPPGVMTWSGLAQELGALPKQMRIGGQRVTSLADANDQGVRFSSIANFIEKNYEVL
jgi:hypothetical protein